MRRMLWPEPESFLVTKQDRLVPDQSSGARDKGPHSRDVRQ
jgi:hypothetical protein